MSSQHTKRQTSIEMCRPQPRYSEDPALKLTTPRSLLQVPAIDINIIGLSSYTYHCQPRLCCFHVNEARTRGKKPSCAGSICLSGSHLSATLRCPNIGHVWQEVTTHQDLLDLVLDYEKRIPSIENSHYSAKLFCRNVI